MKILLITPIHPVLKNLSPLPRYQVQNYWRQALINLGHQVTVFGLAKHQSKLINQLKLKSITRNQSFDHLFLSAGLDKLFPIKDTIFFCGVPPVMLSKSEKLAGKSAKTIVVNDPKHQKSWQKLTKSRVLNLPFSAINPEVFKPKDIKKTIDFSFIGTLFKKRQHQLVKLIEQGINLKIWGWLPPKTQLHKNLTSHYQGEAWGQQVVNIYQKSKMALNLVPDHMVDGGNLRTFEIPACQTLEFIDKINPSYYQPNKEVIVFKSPQDLKNKSCYYLNHSKERLNIAKAGYIKTINSHTFTKRFSSLFTHL